MYVTIFFHPPKYGARSILVFPRAIAVIRNFQEPLSLNSSSWRDVSPIAILLTVDYKLFALLCEMVCAFAIFAVFEVVQS